MRFRKIVLLTLICVSFFQEAAFSQPFISFHLTNQTYQKGKTYTVESDFYFNRETGSLVVHGNYPRENIKTTNRLGEYKIYFPGDNTVSMGQNNAFSTENEMIWYFLSNNYYDLGLSKEGFTVSGTKMDGNYQVVTWMAPLGLNMISRIELVHENGQPVFAAYYDIKGKVIRRIYYYNYEIFTDFMLPLKVSQITYTPSGDSIVQRNTYSGIKLSNFESTGQFNFKIPEDARVVR